MVAAIFDKIETFAELFVVHAVDIVDIRIGAHFFRFEHFVDRALHRHLPHRNVHIGKNAQQNIALVFRIHDDEIFRVV